MTEGNEQLTLHTDSIDELVSILDILGEGGDYQTSGKAEREKLLSIANTIEAQR